MYASAELTSNIHALNTLLFVFSQCDYFLFNLCRCCGYTVTISHGSKPGPSVTSGFWRSWIWVIIHCCGVWKVELSEDWRSCRACTCTAASWPLSPMTSSTSCTACSFSTCRYLDIYLKKLACAHILSKAVVAAAQMKLNQTQSDHI